VQKFDLPSRKRRYRRAWITFLFLAGCATQAGIPTVTDDSIEVLVRNEAAQIIAVSEDKDRSSEYQIFLSDFPRKDVLGMSVGNHRIYIRYELAKLAARRAPYLWLLRQTLAHEIAHETAEHAKQSAAAPLNRGPFLRGVSSADVGLPWNVRFRNYSLEKELEADLKGMEYWQKLGWDCRIWVGILQNFEKQNYAGDVFHPTDRRLQQAQKACLDQQNAKRRAIETGSPQSAG
jgi:predicted Zn-dependent protease